METHKENPQVSSELAKRNINDSVFTDLFKEPEYTLHHTNL
jgi:hypothetical protein